MKVAQTIMSITKCEEVNMAAQGMGDWRELCKAASQEHDPEKLLDLIREINRALSQQARRSPDSQPSHA
jgi:hypothetical protein